MPFVLDASVALCWAFADESHPMAELALSRSEIDTCLVPAIWWFEMRNSLVVNERRQRLSERDSTLFLRRLSGLRITIDPAPDETTLLTLARRHRLTVYDASYLALAQREDIPLASLDHDLLRAAQHEQVRLLQPDTV